MYLKRFFDIVMSAIGLIILSPIFILIAIIICIDTNGGIFFRQTRVGKNGVEFKIHKFRTMVKNAEQIGDKITVGNDSRITNVGHILRKTKLDELPQLIDVFCGYMSFVGPRPEVPEYVKLYPNDIKLIVLSIRPGITDYASILMIDESDILVKSNNPQQYYINEIMPKKLEYAVKYVNNRSFLGDINLIFFTFFKIFMR